MALFPVNMDIRGRIAVIVGGGEVAARKCSALLKAEASVHVIAPKINPLLQELHEAGEISVTLRRYRPGDLAGAVLAFAATESRETNMAVATEATTHGIPVNVATPPEAGTFTMPAAVARGDFLLTVSTGGKCPALAAEIAKNLDGLFGSEYGQVADLLGAVREKLLTEKERSAYNSKILRILARQNLPFLFKNDAYDDIDRLLLDLLGPGFSLAELGVREKDTE